VPGAQFAFGQHVIENVPEVQARYRNEYIISYEIIEKSMNVIIKRRV
jgi:hypothetical protein